MQKLVLGESTFEAVIHSAAECLRRGGVIVSPTETVYGLMTAWMNRRGRERIYQLKARKDSKPLQMLAAGTAEEHTAGEVVPDPRLDKLVEKFCPGPLTIVVQGTADSVGLRIPDSPFVLSLLRHLEGPLAATSANLSGEPPAMVAEDAIKHLVGEPDLLIDGGPLGSAVASTVVSLLDAEVKLLRQGPIPFAAIRQALR